ncbi:hypothetical protein TTHERM_000576959 (macronuclear) [Tetrahymena thermophila SB210]|uniref:Kinase domain protein n=1 Tax=Tetrahymena thermophila (strain SB210) TaxID=312017 RepID=W7XDS6_TETTS|nr:hypothetical protein TTHERM_000576959 [Tetrahymena thermophila SB210]EWS75737.1 hypothetical protein TTHERM_000576959 [Tetrahymena thermophila SB210]|eukprot:XP_012651659.1 hypothetical protein TTHERM_000576959 [Tetrahymena thermophila SB210]
MYNNFLKIYELDILIYWSKQNNNKKWAISQQKQQKQQKNNQTPKIEFKINKLMIQRIKNMTMKKCCKTMFPTIKFQNQEQNISKFVQFLLSNRKVCCTIYYKLIDKQFSQMMRDFSGCKYIIRLEINLCYSKLGEKALKELWKQVGKIQNLQYLVLDLTKNRIDNKDAQYLINSVIQLKKIKHLSLNLNENYLTNDGLNSLLQLYESYQYINCIQLFLEYIIQILFLVFNFSQLSYNLVTWEGILDFCKEISKFNKLYQFSLSVKYFIDQKQNNPTRIIQRCMRESKRLIKIQLFYQ